MYTLASRVARVLLWQSAVLSVATKVASYRLSVFIDHSNKKPSFAFNTTKHVEATYVRSPVITLYMNSIA